MGQSVRGRGMSVAVRGQLRGVCSLVHLRTDPKGRTSAHQPCVVRICMG